METQTSKVVLKNRGLSAHDLFDPHILNGGLGADLIKGSIRNDVIYDGFATTADNFKENGDVKRKTTRRDGNDTLRGRDGDDVIYAQWGSDRMVGGSGNDVLISRSDSSTPAENKKIGANVDDGNDVDKLKFNSKYYNPKGLQANDRMRGGQGADTFRFELDINAGKDIVQKHTRGNGTVKWGMNGVAGENNNYHDHWVDGIGKDTIVDFSGRGGEGDKIEIVGHTVTYKVISESDNQTTLGIYSDQGADGVRGGGAHDLDVLGVIKVNHDGNFDADKDVTVINDDLGAYQDKAREDQPNIFGGGLGKNNIKGTSQDDVMVGDVDVTADNFNAKGYVNMMTRRQFGNDRLKGLDGNDLLIDQFGSDRMFGGDGDDVIVSLSDSGVSKENKKIGANVDDGNDVDKLVFKKKFYNPSNLKAND
ncbi:MAG: calcium-binding protein, partial [Leptolyngbya sp. SIO3F4]|nr:calcium-binding protein [Leptolyngbya sp. SIO3F4]